MGLYIAAIAENDFEALGRSLPLTILEAMRAGAVAIATDVGAVSEVLRHGENGIVVPLRAAVPQCLTGIEALATNKTRLGGLAQQAMRDSAGRTWAEAVRDSSRALAV